MSAPAIGATLLVVASLAAACSSPTTTVAQQVRAWAQSTGWATTVRQLHGDLGRLSGLAADSAGARRTVCDVLVTDALSANQQLPTPDRTLTMLLSDAYSAAGAAGRDCFNGAPARPADSARAAGAVGALVRAQARYDSLTSTLPGAS